MIYVCAICKQEVNQVYADETATLLKGKVIKRWLCQRHWFNKRNKDLKDIENEQIR